MENLKSYLLTELDELKGVVAEINAYNGSLDYLEVYENQGYVIDELFSSPYEALKSVYYGYYNIYNDLFKINAYGNIESLSEAEYKVEMQENVDDIIEELLKVYNNLNITDELKELVENVLKGDNYGK